MKPRHALRMGNAQSRTMTGLLFFCPFSIIHTQKSRRSLYGIYQSGGYGPSDARCCPRCRSGCVGCGQPHGGKIFCTSITSLSHISKIAGHQAVDGRWRRGTHRHDPHPPAVRFVLITGSPIHMGGREMPRSPLIFNQFPT